MTNHLNRMHLGDCTHIMHLLQGCSVDLIVTDPPYLVNYRDRSARSIANDQSSDWLKPAFAEMFRVLRHNRFAVSFYGWNHAIIVMHRNAALIERARE